MAVDLSDLRRQLLDGRVPFVQATVVRAQVPASAKPGDGAIVLRDGSIEGFVGGQCARGSVRTAALGAIRDGRSVLLRVLPEESESFPETPGAHVVVNPCLSGGALEIFLQPLLPDPVIGVFGDSPIVAALEELSPLLGFVVERDTELSGGETAVVIAAHGGDEAGLVRAALDAGVGYVGLVASPRRSAGVLAPLELSEEERARVHSPVGLDIGASTAAEVALSILAQLVQAIRREGLTAPDPAGAPKSAETRRTKDSAPAEGASCCGGAGTDEAGHVEFLEIPQVLRATGDIPPGHSGAAR